MPKPSCVQTFRQCQFYDLEQLRARGLIQVKLAVADGDHVRFEERARVAVDFYLKHPDEVPDDEFERMEQKILASYLLDSGHEMAEFRIEGLGAVGVQMSPWRSTPVLGPFFLKGDRGMDRTPFKKQFPMLQEISDFVSYHWRTPRYQEICAELGINPLREAPEFHRDHDALAWRLLDWDVEKFTPVMRSDGFDAHTARNIVFDILDVLRTDDRRNSTHVPPAVLQEVRQHRDLLERFDVPCLSEIEALLEAGTE